MVAYGPLCVRAVLPPHTADAYPLLGSEGHFLTPSFEETIIWLGDSVSLLAASLY
jgi:hypothetical protein